MSFLFICFVFVFFSSFVESLSKISILLSLNLSELPFSHLWNGDITHICVVRIKWEPMSSIFHLQLQANHTTLQARYDETKKTLTEVSRFSFLRGPSEESFGPALLMNAACHLSVWRSHDSLLRAQVHLGHRTITWQCLTCAVTLSLLPCPSPSTI